MHHIADPIGQTALAEMVRVVQPGGAVMVWDHNPRNPYWPYLMKRVPQDRGDERLSASTSSSTGSAGAAPIRFRSRSSGWCRTSSRERLLGVAAAVERAAERTPGLRRLCAHNVVVAVRR